MVSSWGAAVVGSAGVAGGGAGDAVRARLGGSAGGALLPGGCGLVAGWVDASSEVAQQWAVVGVVMVRDSLGREQNILQCTSSRTKRPENECKHVAAHIALDHTHDDPGVSVSVLVSGEVVVMWH